MHAALKKQYVNWINKSFSYKQLDDIIRIDTPFLDNFSDEIVIYAIPKPNDFIKLTDDGWTIDNLESQGIFIHHSKKREKLLNMQLKTYGINLTNNDELTINADVKDFPIAKHRLLQAILFVNDMFMLSNNNTRNFFIEDMDKYFLDNNIRVLKDASFIGESGLNHKFDYSIPGLGEKIPDKLIKVLAGGNNDMFAKAIVTDVEQTKNVLKNKNTQFFTFINDYKNDKKIEIHNDILNLFNNSDIYPILYSEREIAVEKFK